MGKITINGCVQVTYSPGGTYVPDWLQLHTISKEREGTSTGIKAGERGQKKNQMC